MQSLQCPPKIPTSWYSLSDIRLQIDWDFGLVHTIFLLSHSLTPQEAVYNVLKSPREKLRGQEIDEGPWPEDRGH